MYFKNLYFKNLYLPTAKRGKCTSYVLFDANKEKLLVTLQRESTEK